MSNPVANAPVTTLLATEKTFADLNEEKVNELNFQLTNPGILKG